MTGEPRTHDDWLDSAALYAIDAMDGDDRRAFEDHLRSCAECRAEVAGMRPVNEALGRAVPQLDPPFALRQRVMESALGAAAGRAQGFGSARGDTGASRPRIAASTWLGAAAALLVAAGFGAYASSLYARLTSLEGELAAVRTQAATSRAEAEAAREVIDRTQRHLDVLTAPDSARVSLVGGTPAPNASGRADWSPSRGLAVSTNNLPAVAPGRTYQVWLLTSGAPVSAGLLRPDASGRSAAVYVDLPAGIPATGVAFSEEADGGVPAPTGQIYLVGKIARASPAR